MNKLFGRLMVSQRGGKSRSRRTVRRYNGPAAPQPNAEMIEGIQSYARSAGAAKLINTGRRSQHNVETPLHQNSVSLKITNNGANRADLVLSAGFLSDDADLADQIITDGTFDTTNDAAQVANVTVQAEFGIEGTAKAWERFLGYVNRQGLLISTTRFEYSVKSQKQHKFRMKADDMFGDHVIDHISPSVYYNPTNQDLNFIQSDIQYKMTEHDLIKYSVEPGCEVTLTFFIAGRLELTRFLENYMRKTAVNSAG